MTVLAQDRRAEIDRTAESGSRPTFDVAMPAQRVVLACLKGSDGAYIGCLDSEEMRTHAANPERVRPRGPCWRAIPVGSSLPP